MRKNRPLRRAIVKAIGDALKASGVSERELSARLGQHKNYINEILHGQHVVKADELFEIAYGLGMSPHDLVAQIVAIVKRA